MTPYSNTTWKSEIDALLNTIIYATIMRDELRERLTALLESARASGVEEAAQLLEDGARVSELHARETICSQTRDMFLHLAKFERLHAEDIRALITDAGEGAASAPHPMEAAARLVDEWSAANFRTSAERPDPSALLDLVKRLAARKEGT